VLTGNSLVSLGWHPLWIVVCDEAWSAMLALQNLLAGVASDTRLNWDFWAWFVFYNGLFGVR
jgi:hypothetical protein